jgi:hypothetical protein
VTAAVAGGVHIVAQERPETEAALGLRTGIRPARVNITVDGVTNAAACFTRFNMRAVEGCATSRTLVIEMDGQDVPGIRLQYPPVPVMCPVCR